MDVKERLKQYLSQKGISQREFAEKMNLSSGYVNAIRKSIQPDKLAQMKLLYNDLNIDWLLTGEGNMLLPVDKKEEAIRALNEIKKKKRSKILSEGRLIDESELVEAEQFIIPIPGQAGLKKAFFAPDQYIEDHFEKEIILVRPKDRAVYHKIEVDGNSMPGIVDKGDWARCVDIPKTEWLKKDTFKPNKVYCLFHRYRGPLFKRITNAFLDSITLSSDNTDKDEYPDEVFDLAEFSKIFRVVVVEKTL